MIIVKILFALLCCQYIYVMYSLIKGVSKKENYDYIIRPSKIIRFYSLYYSFGMIVFNIMLFIFSILSEDIEINIMLLFFLFIEVFYFGWILIALEYGCRHIAIKDEQIYIKSIFRKILINIKDIKYLEKEKLNYCSAYNKEYKKLFTVKMRENSYLLIDKIIKDGDLESIDIKLNHSYINEKYSIEKIDEFEKKGEEFSEIKSYKYYKKKALIIAFILMLFFTLCSLLTHFSVLIVASIYIISFLIIYLNKKKKSIILIKNKSKIELGFSQKFSKINKIKRNNNYILILCFFLIFISSFVSLSTVINTINFKYYHIKTYSELEKTEVKCNSIEYELSNDILITAENGEKYKINYYYLSYIEVDLIDYIKSGDNLIFYYEKDSYEEYSYAKNIEYLQVNDEMVLGPAQYENYAQTQYKKYLKYSYISVPVFISFIGLTALTYFNCSKKIKEFLENN